jgi:hypothetical protein
MMSHMLFPEKCIVYLLRHRNQYVLCTVIVNVCEFKIVFQGAWKKVKTN